jgi:hypothetical protein
MNAVVCKMYDKRNHIAPPANSMLTEALKSHVCAAAQVPHR